MAHDELDKMIKEIENMIKHHSEQVVRYQERLRILKDLRDVQEMRDKAWVEANASAP